MGINRGNYLLLSKVEKREDLINTKRKKNTFYVNEVVGFHLRSKENFYNKIFRQISAGVRKSGFIYNVTDQIIEYIDYKTEICQNILAFEDKLKPTSGMMLTNEGVSLLYNIESMPNTNALKVNVFRSFQNHVKSFTRIILDFKSDEIAIDGNVSFSDENGVYEYESPLFILAVNVFLQIVEHKEKLSNHEIIKKVCNKSKNIEPSNNLPILRIDSTWFTTTKRTKEFMVNGFVKNQAYGKGWKLHRKIWIDSFKKKGYTRNAKMLSK